MPLAFALLVIAVLIGLLWVAFAKDPGPAPADVAIAYELAWLRLDFALLYDLSGAELRDGMRRDEFVAAKRAAQAASGPGPEETGGATVTVDELVEAGGTALVVTRVATAEGAVRNEVVLELRANGWCVVRYSLRPDVAAS